MSGLATETSPQSGRLTRRRRRRRRLTKWRLHKTQWIDPYPWIPGTEPEKRIFAELIKRGLYFVFQDTLEEWKLGITAGAQVPSFVPDFVLPQYRVILDPFGDYHHTLPDSVERDIRKAEEYAVLGYRFYHPWASEVEKHGAAHFLNLVPEVRVYPPPYVLPIREYATLAQGYRLGPYVGIGTKSVAAANKARARAISPVLKRRRRAGVYR